MNVKRFRSPASLATAGLGLLILVAASGAAVAPTRSVAQQHRQRNPATSCTQGTGAFVGAGSGNVACDTDSAVVGGEENAVSSGADSIVGAGQFNTISAEDSAILDGTANTVSGPYSVIAGGQGHSVAGSDAAIAGGIANSVASFAGFIGGGSHNSVTGNGSAIAGGNSREDARTGNQISGLDSFIGSGDGNTISSTEAVIGGGDVNSVTSTYGTIAGGSGNQVTGKAATIAGGTDNVASGNAAMVAGGYHNLASGQYSFAAGFGSYANTNGSFVWSDFSQGSKHLEPTAANQFIARAAGGVIFLSNAAETTGVRLAPGSGAWGSASDRNLKRDVATVNDADILAKVAALPVSEWSYTSEGGVRHLGPMAQDFYTAFGVGEDDRHITSIDEDGVALAAIKALNAKLTSTLRTLRAKDSEVGSLRVRLASQGDELRAMRAELSDLEARLPRR
jgi:hypothetical protein